MIQNILFVSLCITSFHPQNSSSGAKLYFKHFQLVFSHEQINQMVINHKLKRVAK